MLTIEDIITLGKMGYTSADVAAMQAAQAPAPVAPAPVAPAPVAPVAPAPVAPAPAPAPAAPVAPVAPAPAPAPAAPVAPTNPDQFVNYLAQLGASAGVAPAPVAPAPVAPAPAPAPAGPASTPLTVEQATQLFQQFTVNGVANGIDLPPNVDDVLASRFNSLYGVDTSKGEK